MNILEIIKDVERFTVSENSICLVRKQNLEIIEFQDLAPKQVFTFIERMEFVYSNGSYFWINSNSGKGFYIFEGKVFSRGNYILLIDQESMLYEISNVGISKVNLVSQVVKWTIPYNSLLVFCSDNRFFVRTFSSEITAFSSENGEKEWTYSFNSAFDYFENISANKKKKATVSRIIGHHFGILWIALNSGRLLGIDIITGELKYNICNPNNGPVELMSRNTEHYLHYGLYLNLDKQGNLLFGLRGKYYFEIDLSDPQNSYSMYDISFELERNGFFEANVSGNGYENVWNENSIYFGERDSEGPSVGLFNRSTKQISWFSKKLYSNNYKPNIISIQYSQNRLFVLDGTGQLHIFNTDV